jgi:hypothetical protein
MTSNFKNVGDLNAGRRSPSGGDPAEMNEALSNQPRRTDLGGGAKGRDAGTVAGIESGCYMKTRVGSSLATDGSELGKPLPPFGTPPWPSAVMVDAPLSVTDTFGAGQTHQIKNG